MRRVFKGLGTAIELRVWPERGRERMAAGNLAQAATFLRRAEARLSRFDRRSELSRLNRASGNPRRVSSLAFAVIRAALAAAEATEGLFDPTVLRVLQAAGYDRNFDELRQRTAPSHSEVGAGAPFVGQWRGIRLDASTRTVCLPRGVGIDLGGIAKGWLADRVLRTLQRAGAAYVDLGGDIALSSAPKGTDTWRIEVEDPRAAGCVAGIIRVTGGGIATSGITRRTWTAGGEVRHHLIDPRTGRPARTDLLSVTVAAPTAAAAEVAAKSVLLLGSKAGRLALLQSEQLAGVLLPNTGAPIIVGDCGDRGLNLEWSATG